MIIYTEERVKDIARNIFKKQVKLSPVGNHELNRHLVYHVTDEEGLSLIFKLFFKKNRWNREVATLRLLSNTGVKCPNLVDYGVLDDGTEWVIIEHLPGEPFERVKEQIPINEQRNILNEMGMELGKIHSFRTFEHFGNWDENGNSMFKFIDFKPAFIRSAEIVITQLLGLNLPEKNLYVKGVQRLREQYSLLESVKYPRLCHNDFDARNVLVKKCSTGWELSGVIDFEQSFPWDSDKDIVSLYYAFCKNDKVNEQAIIKGYTLYHPFSNNFYVKKDFYLLFNSLSICSWAYVQAPDHYRQGVELLEELL